MTVDRYGRTVAFVKVGDTVVNEELIRQGLARVFSRYCGRAICEWWQRLEDEARAAGIVVYTKCHTAVGVPEKWKITSGTAPFLSQRSLPARRQRILSMN